MSLVSWILAVCVLPLATADRPLTGAEKKKVADAYAAAMREPDAKKAAAAARKVEPLARRLDHAGLEGILRDATPGRAPQKGWKPGFVHGIAFDSGSATYRYSVHLPRVKSGAKGELLPLVVDPGHISLAKREDAETEAVMETWLGLTGATDDVIYVRTRIFDQLANEGDYDAWVARQRKKGGANHDTMARALLDAIADACRRFPVDPDRVVVHGISMTGYWTWYAGASAPGRFAALVPVSSVTWHVRELAENFCAERVFVLHGKLDETCPFEQAEAMVRALEPVAAQVTLVAVEDGEHVKNTFPRWGGLWPDVEKARRERYPRRIARRLFGPETPDVAWLVADDIDARAFDVLAPPARLAGTIEDQVIRVESEGVDRVRVLLATDLVDLSRPITIEVNGKKRFEGVAAPDPATAFDVAWRRGDGGAVYSASVVVPGGG